MAQQQTRLGAFAVHHDAQERLLLVQQVGTQRWSLPGGGVRFGESPMDALRREVDEETGMRVVSADLRGVHDNVYDPGDGILRHGVRLLFRVELHGEIALRSPEEISAVQWFGLRDLPPRLTAWAQQATRLEGDRGSGEPARQRPAPEGAP